MRQTTLTKRRYLRPLASRSGLRGLASSNPPMSMSSTARVSVRSRLFFLTALCSVTAVLAAACGSSEPTEPEDTSPATSAAVSPTDDGDDNGDGAVASPATEPEPLPEPPEPPPQTTTTTETAEPPTTTQAPPTTTTQAPEPPDDEGSGSESGQEEDDADSGSDKDEIPQVNPSDYTTKPLCEAAGFFWNGEVCAASLPPYDAPGDLEVPQPLPVGSPGELIDTELLDTGGDVVGYRILYYSKSLRGEDIAVSGFAAAPAGEAPEGGWPLVAWAHGTTGMADACAPSHTAESAIAQFAPLLNAGYAVVATDYEGLGTPGLHPYIVGVSEGRSVLDSVRAVQSLPQISASKKFVVWGHSQGGHAALHAGQHWPEYAPSLSLIGVVSSAPPSQFSLIYDVLANGLFRGYLVMAIAAFAYAYDEADLEDILTPEAIDLLEVLEEECAQGVLQRFAQLDLSELQTVENPLRVEPWDALTQKNDVNQKPTQVPVLLLHGGSDEQVPAISSLVLLNQLCALPGRGPTHRIEYPGERHSSVIIASWEDMLEWIQDRFSGESAPDSCENG